MTIDYYYQESPATFKKWPCHYRRHRSRRSPPSMLKSLTSALPSLWLSPTKKTRSKPKRKPSKTLRTKKLFKKRANTKQRSPKHSAKTKASTSFRNRRDSAGTFFNSIDQTGHPGRVSINGFRRTWNDKKKKATLKSRLQ